MDFNGLQAFFGRNNQRTPTTRRVHPIAS